MIYWFTGQPSHGKTTLSKLFKENLNCKAFQIDGDSLRSITLNKDYSKKGRLENVNSAQKIANYLHSEGYTVIVSLVSPYRSQREEFKKFLGNKIKEIYVHTTERRERDCYNVKDYEKPLENYLDIDTTKDTPLESLMKIKKLLNKQKQKKD